MTDEQDIRAIDLQDIAEVKVIPVQALDPTTMIVSIQPHNSKIGLTLNDECSRCDEWPVTTVTVPFENTTVGVCHQCLMNLLADDVRGLATQTLIVTPPTN